MDYLSFELSEGDDGISTLEAMASTREEHHSAVMAEVQRVLDWAWRHFAHAHGPVEDGMDWDHDLQSHVEPGGWHSVNLTITASNAFSHAFVQQFGLAD